MKPHLQTLFGFIMYVGTNIKLPRASRLHDKPNSVVLMALSKTLTISTRESPSVPQDFSDSHDTTATVLASRRADFRDAARAATSNADWICKPQRMIKLHPFIIVGGGGGYSTDVRVGRCGWGAQTLTLFNRKL